MSKDAVSVATLVGGYLMLRVLADSFSGELGRFIEYCFVAAASRPVGQMLEFLPELETQALMVVVKTVGPILLVTILCAVAATFWQTRFLITTESLKPKLEHLNPLAGIMRLFSLRSLIEVLKNIVKIVILLVIIYTSLTGIFQDFFKYLYTDVSAACQHLFDSAADMIFKIIIAFVAIAGFDFFYQRWDYERQLKMSKEEIKEEFKQTEGDPKVKARIRQIQRQRAMSRMIQQVPQADVVIRNPTHFAVALRYKPERDNAPIVLAKGTDELALRIVRVAEENGVAVVENVELARALYAGADLEREIPPDLYGAVAEILVYIFRLNENKEIVK